MTDGIRPLDGIRVLDIATFLAGPFCSTVLGEFGAEVIKVEQPGTGDPLRKFGTPHPSGDSLVWLSEARNKKSITLNLREPEGAQMLKRLVAQSHIVVENFRTGTLERWGVGYEDLEGREPGHHHAQGHGLRSDRAQGPGAGIRAHRPCLLGTLLPRRRARRQAADARAQRPLATISPAPTAPWGC